MRASRTWMPMMLHAARISHTRLVNSQSLHGAKSFPPKDRACIIAAIGKRDHPRLRSGKPCADVVPGIKGEKQTGPISRHSADRRQRGRTQVNIQFYEACVGDTLSMMSGPCMR